MRVALLQIASPDEESFDDRLVRVESLLRELPSDVALALLPELWGVGYGHFDRYEDAAESLDGPTVTMARRVAADRGLHVHVGSIVERTDDGALRNTSVLVDPSGAITHTFSKIHVFGYESLETQLLRPGTSLDVVDSPFGRLAGTTCYDLRFSGLWQELRDRGAELVTVPAAWPAPRRLHWGLFTQTRAVEHQLWLLACNAVGTHGGITFGGASRVVAPTGEIVASAPDDAEAVVLADVDPSVVATVRAEFPVLQDRLGDYRGLSGPTA